MYSRSSNKLIRTCAQHMFYKSIIPWSTALQLQKTTSCYGKMIYLCQACPFVVFLQLNSHEAAVTLKPKKLIAYPTHEELLSFSLCWRCWLIKNGPTGIWIPRFGYGKSRECLAWDDVTSVHRLTCRYIVEVQSFVPLAWDGLGRFLKMEMIYRAEKMVMEAFKFYKLSGFLTLRKICITGNCFPFVVL